MSILKVKDLENYLQTLEHIFDFVRLVDPNEKKVINPFGLESIIHGPSCYEFWGKGKACKNCISKSSWINKETITKIEYTKDRVFLVMVTPIEFEGNIYIVELLKDIDVMIRVNGVNIEDTSQIISDLNAKVIRDELTEIYNRRYINNILPKEIEMSKKNKECSTIIMLDVDNFKKVNDKYGYIAGDLVLKELASIVQSKIRKNHDWVARYGGDEFLVFLKNGDIEIAHKVIQEVRHILDKKYFVFKNDKVKISVSAGITIIDCVNKNIKEVINEADRNLKKDKRVSKNAMT